MEAFHETKKPDIEELKKRRDFTTYAYTLSVLAALHGAPLAIIPAVVATINGEIIEHNIKIEEEKEMLKRAM